MFAIVALITSSADLVMVDLGAVDTLVGVVVGASNDGNNLVVSGECFVRALFSVAVSRCALLTNNDEAVTIDWSGVLCPAVARSPRE